MTGKELLKQYHDQQEALGGGCSDGYCVIKKTVGVHTNGGCSCLRNLDFMRSQRVGVILKIAQAMADHIEDLNVKLANAVEDAFCEGFAEGYDGTWVEGDYTHAWKKSHALAALGRTAK